MSTDTRIPIVGLVGGIGSGKSAVAEWAARYAGIEVVNGDRIGHEVLHDSEVIDRIRERFGPEIIAADGRVDRTALGRRVFGPSSAQRQARSDLEAIVHPRIVSRFRKAIDEVKSTRRSDAVVLDAAVLLEAGWAELCDAVAYVEVADETRLARVKTRGWDAAELKRREASQWPLDEKRRRADRILTNNGDIETAGRELLGIIDELSRQPMSAS